MSDWRAKIARLASGCDEFSTQQVIAALGGVSRKTVIGHLNTLTSVGAIMRVRRGVYGGAGYHGLKPPRKHSSVIITQVEKITKAIARLEDELHFLPDKGIIRYAGSY